MIPQQVLLLDPLEPRLLLLVLRLEEVVPRCKLVLPAVFNQIWSFLAGIQGRQCDGVLISPRSRLCTEMYFSCRWVFSFPFNSISSHLLSM